MLVERRHREYKVLRAHVWGQVSVTLDTRAYYVKGLSVAQELHLLSQDKPDAALCSKLCPHEAEKPDISLAVNLGINFHFVQC